MTIRVFAPYARCWLGTALALCVSGVSAQSPAATATTPGSDALPTALHFVSPIFGYRKYVEQPMESWPKANERVGRIGGWRAYAQEKPDGADVDDAETPPPLNGGEMP